MIQQPLDQLAILQEKIEDALEKSNFEQLQTLSNRLESLVTLMISAENRQTTPDKDEIAILVKLAEKVKKYEYLTAEKFKHYTYGLSVAPWTKIDIPRGARSPGISEFQNLRQ